MTGPITLRRLRTTRILIVDDHPLLCRGLAQLINDEPDLEVCGDAADVEEAMEQVLAQRPELVIVDISLKDSSGLELIKRIKDHDERILMLVASMHDATRFAARVLPAGASGYVDKHEAPDKMIEAIRAVLRGKVYLCSSLTHKDLPDTDKCRQPTLRLPLEMLSNQEWVVFESIGRGKTTRSIANTMGLGIKTIETYRDNIKHKLHLSNGAQLTCLAARWIVAEK